MATSEAPKKGRQSGGCEYSTVKKQQSILSFFQKAAVPRRSAGDVKREENSQLGPLKGEPAQELPPHPPVPGNESSKPSDPDPSVIKTELSQPSPKLFPEDAEQKSSVGPASSFTSTNVPSEDEQRRLSEGTATRSAESSPRPSNGDAANLFDSTSPCEEKSPDTSAVVPRPCAPEEVVSEKRALMAFDDDPPSEDILEFKRRKRLKVLQDAPNSVKADENVDDTAEDSLFANDEEGDAEQLGGGAAQDGHMSLKTGVSAPLDSPNNAATDRKRTSQKETTSEATKRSEQSSSPPVGQRQSEKGLARPSVGNGSRSRSEDVSKLFTCHASKASGMFREYLDNWLSMSSQFSLPPWVDPRHIRDSKGRRPTDPSYDFTTMWIPPPSHPWAKEHKAPHLTPGMQQYWDIKATNFDKVVFFKMGRFYEIFYMDAAIGQRVCDLKWMGGGEQKPHVGFPEQSLHQHAKELIENGYRVVVVEQMETPKELEERNRATAGPKDKAVRREVCEVYSQGTLLHDDLLGPAAQHLMSLYFDEPIGGSAGGSSQSFPTATGGFGLCFVDVATCNVHTAYVRDGRSRNALATTLSQVAPSEILYSPSNLPGDVSRILKAMPNPPQLTPISAFPEGIAAQQELETYFPESESANAALPSAVRELFGKKEAALCAFAGVCKYLRSNLVDQKVLRFSRFEVYRPFEQHLLILDAAALRNLEVLQTQEGKLKHSLFDFLNRTVTPFGSRLLRRWVCAPLIKKRLIEQRLNSLEWLMRNKEAVEVLRRRLGKLPDIERKFSQMCAQALRSERGAVYFDMIPNKQLEKFDALLGSFEEAASIAEFVRGCGESDSFPERLESLVKRVEEGGLFPDLVAICESFKGKVTRSPDDSTLFIPAKGADPEYDSLQDVETDLKRKLERVVVKMGREWELPLKFVHAKFRYEVECPDNAPKRLLKDWECDITSTRKGFYRFQTPEIKDLLEELDDLEQKQKDALYPFMNKLLMQFYQHSDHFIAAIRVLAELDVLAALSVVVVQSEGLMCRPEFHEPDDSPPILLLKDCSHPVISSLMDNFIPNDTYMNAEGVTGGTLLVTGPNMGGKSTVLRQTCVAIVMAQLGCYVAARECQLTPVDKLFTRIGARDAILEGKSTFLVELEETCTILTHATRHSFAVIDELGRGTSTFDGTAIAMATLEYMAMKLECRSMFSTHFHLLCEEFRSIPCVCNFHMAADVDEEQGTVTFLYKLKSGACPKSHGMNVARLAGLPEEVLRCAAQKSAEFEGVSSSFHTLTRRKKIARELIQAVKRTDSAAIRSLFEKFRDDAILQADSS